MQQALPSAGNFAWSSLVKPGCCGSTLSSRYRRTDPIGKLILSVVCTDIFNVNNFVNINLDSISSCENLGNVCSVSDGTMDQILVERQIDKPES